MLQAIRDKSKGILGGVIVALLGIPFAFFGIQNYFFTQIDDTVARVNDVEISLDQFQYDFNRERAQMRARFGQSLDASYFDQPMIRRQILDNMIQRELLTQAMGKAGFEIPAERLREEIDNIEVFKVDGQFDADVYRSVLRQQGMTPKMFQDRLREDLLLQQLPAALNNTSLVLAGEIASVARLQNQSRSFRYLTLSAADFLEQAVISEEEIQQQYDDQPQRYMAQEKVTIEYLELDAAQLEIAGEPDDEMLRQRYEEQRLRFVLPERRLTSHILINVGDNADAETLKLARDKAQALADRARAGEAFADLASESSEDTGSAELGGDLGWVERDMMVSAFEDALFAMSPGDISDPVNTSFGFHVIWLRELEETRGKTFEEARSELAQEARESEAERMFLDQQDLLLELTFEDQGTLIPAAERLGLEIMTEGPFDRSGGQGIAAEPAVVEAAFSELVLNEGINSDPITVAANDVVFLRVIEHIEASPRPLEEVQDEIRAELTNARASELAKAATEALLLRLADGEELEALAAAENLAVTNADAVRRNGPGHDNQLVRAVFQMPRPGDNAVNKLIEFGGDKFALVSLSLVADPDPSEFTEAQNEALKNRIAQSFAQSEVVGLSDWLRETAEVQVAEEKIQRQQTIN